MLPKSSTSTARTINGPRAHRDGNAGEHLVHDLGIADLKQGDAFREWLAVGILSENTKQLPLFS